MSIVIKTILTLALFALAGFGAGELVGGMRSKQPTLPAVIPMENADIKLNPLVRLHDRATGDFFCSGVVISQNYIVTAGHCLEGRKLLKKSIEVRSLDNTPIKNYAAPAFSEQRSDQGLVIGNFSDFNAQPYSVQTTFVVSAFLSPEAQIMTCGFPYGGTAICEPVNNRHPFYFGFMADGVLYPGMSGGPVMVNMSGTGVVVGVNTAMIEGEAFYSPLVELLHHAKVEGQ